jgi:hypothetical protein
MVSIRRLAVLMAAISAPGWADAVVTTSLNVSVQIDPSSRTVTYSSPIAHWFMRQVNMHLACSQFHIHRLQVPRIFDSQIWMAL